MDERELNRKLAEWAGFRLVKGVAIPYWLDPNGGSITRSGDYPLQLTQSLDACFKWLMPKLDSAWSVRIIKYVDSPLFHIELTYCTLKYGELKSENVNPALALCLAVEKLIDKEVFSEGNQDPNPKP